MIKNLLNADEEPPPGTKVTIEETVINPAPQTSNIESAAIDETASNFETRPVFEIPEDAKFFAPQAEKTEEIPQTSEIAESHAEPDRETIKNEFVNSELPEAETIISSNFEQFDDEIKTDDQPAIFQSEFKPETPAETVRQSGLAYSAAIVFFGSVVFMLVIGWFADLLLGSSPWGIVGGILLGGIIGFVQFFRITSQIFKK